MKIYFEKKIRLKVQELAVPVGLAYLAFLLVVYAQNNFSYGLLLASVLWVIYTYFKEPKDRPY